MLEDIFKTLKADLDPRFIVAPMRIKLPQEAVDSLNEVWKNSVTQGVEEDNNEFDPREIDPNKIDKDLISFMYESARTYVWDTLDRREDLFKEFDMRIGQVRVNSQFENDFTPINSRIGVVTGLIHLKVPTQVDLTQGALSFVYGDYHYPTLKNQGVKSVKPEIGDMYIFPAWLLHYYNPFKGDGELRTLSYNFYNENAI